MLAVGYSSVLLSLLGVRQVSHWSTTHAAPARCFLDHNSVPLGARCCRSCTVCAYRNDRWQHFRRELVDQVLAERDMRVSTEPINCWDKFRTHDDSNAMYGVWH